MLLSLNGLSLYHSFLVGIVYPKDLQVASVKKYLLKPIPVAWFLGL